MKVASSANDFFLDPVVVPCAGQFYKDNGRGSAVAYNNTFCHKFMASESNVVFDDPSVIVRAQSRIRHMKLTWRQMIDHSRCVANRERDL